MPRSKTSVHHYEGSNVDLGTAAGKLYRVGVMSIQDAGDSDLVSTPLAQSATETEEFADDSSSRLRLLRWMHCMTRPISETCKAYIIERVYLFALFAL